MKIVTIRLDDNTVQRKNKLMTNWRAIVMYGLATVEKIEKDNLKSSTGGWEADRRAIEKGNEQWKERQGKPAREEPQPQPMDDLPY